MLNFVYNDRMGETTDKERRTKLEERGKKRKQEDKT